MSIIHRNSFIKVAQAAQIVQLQLGCLLSSLVLIKTYIYNRQADVTVEVPADGPEIPTDVENADTISAYSISYRVKFRGLFGINVIYMLYFFASICLPLLSHSYVGWKFGLKKFVPAFFALCWFLIGVPIGIPTMNQARIQVLNQI